MCSYLGGGGDFWMCITVVIPICQNTEQNTLRPILDGVQQSWWTDIAYLVSTYELDGNVKTYWGIYDVEIGWILS
jgi:hypothetical protein